MEDWEKKLDEFFEQQREYEEAQKRKAKADTAARTETTKQSEEFILQTVDPAFSRLVDKLEQREKQAFIAENDTKRVFEVWSEATREFKYTLWTDDDTVFRKFEATPESGCGEKNNGQMGNISNITKDNILNDFVDNYTRTIRLGRMP